MIVAAVDISGSIVLIPDYFQQVFKILSKLNPPIEVIRWNYEAKTEIFNDVVPDLRVYEVNGGTDPTTFLRLLSDEYPIDLYIFTDGQIDKYDVARCRQILKERNLQISSVRLHYIGNHKDMNLKFTNVFEGITQYISINSDSIGQIKPSINFDEINYDYIMKDDSFKATVLSQLNSPNIDKRDLKNKITKLSSRILKEYFWDKHTIKNFYEENNIDDCINYVKKHSYYDAKVQFQRKISDILNLFDKDVDMYSLDVFKKLDEPSLLQYETPNSECELLTCDILYENCQTISFPVKKFKNNTFISEIPVDDSDDFYISKKMFINPLKLLEYKHLRKKIADLVEPGVIDYKAYKQIPNSHISPFTRNILQGVFVLSNRKIAYDALIKHNNYILSTLFNDTLPGHSVLWQMTFLYVWAMDKFPERKSRLFEEIRYLGNGSQYFITLSPHLNPPIVENLNVCFWYIANVCHRAFPNSKKNVLRSALSQTFLEFYQNVYDENYEFPTEMPIWQLWKVLCNQPKNAIFNILCHYFDYEKYDDVSIKDFNIVLYDRPQCKKPPVPLDFLKHLDLKTVLSVYKYFIKASSHSHYENIELEEIAHDEFLSLKSKSTKDTLDHIEINLRTCHPRVICPVTKKHWKDCIGEYNVKKESYLRLFKRYCLKYKMYPPSRNHLIVFLNEYIFKSECKMPELFSISLEEEMEGVLLKFKEVMETYYCLNYLKISDKYCSENVRLKFE